MVKILVVDDEEDLKVLIRQKFRKKIRQNEYAFVFAQNGRIALEQLSKHDDIDLVLSDINMPEMDGLTLLSKLNETNKILKSVIVSAYGDMENIRTAMNRGAFDFITKPIDFKDLEITIEKTIAHVKMMHRTIKAVKENNILRMYVDENVINFMGSREFEKSLLANESIDGSVMFVDVCGFTSISESVSADKVVYLINNYFDIMVKEIIDQEGFIDKFIGDAIMAVFRGDYHLDRALDAAISIRDKISALPNVEAFELFKPSVSIGIKSGEMVSGNIGSSSLKRLDYTVIGDTVNTAARLENEACANQIFISEDEFVKVKESFQCKLYGDVTVKNKKRPLKVYEVIS